MINQLTAYRFQPQPGLLLSGLEGHLDKARFAPTGPTQQQSVGWVPPRGIEHGALVESIGGHHLMMACIEKRAVPGQTIKARVAEMAAEVEKDTGRKPGKKLQKELKEQALLELLPMAFVKKSATPVWLDAAAGLLIVGSASDGRAEEIASLLVKTLDGAAIVNMVHTEQTPAGCMAAWLQEAEPPYLFTLDRECELKSSDEQKSVVRYSRHRLDTDEIREHIKQGKTPTRVAMTWRDRVSFTLTDNLKLKKLALLDVAMEAKSSTAGTTDDAFDADAAITTGELAPMLQELFDALGGLIQQTTEG
jgi:recombination associated protein RdgC